MSSSNNHITAFFKHSPLEKNDDPAMSANRAIVCALKLQAPLSKWTQQYSRHCDLATTVALTSGKALVGLMGPLKQQSLSAYGPPIAFVEQLSALSKLYDIPILVDTNTRLALVPNIIAREVDTVMPAFSTAALEQTRVPEKLYEVVGIGRVSQDREESIVSYELGLKEYREQNWNSGMIQFKKV